MHIITIIGAGQMGSAMCFPARSNGHEVRLVGTPLDREIIQRARTDGWHIHLKRYLPQGVRYYQPEEMQAALEKLRGEQTENLTDEELLEAARELSATEADIPAAEE